MNCHVLVWQSPRVVQAHLDCVLHIGMNTDGSTRHTRSPQSKPRRSMKKPASLWTACSGRVLCRWLWGGRRGPSERPSGVSPPSTRRSASATHTTGGSSPNVGSVACAVACLRNILTLAQWTPATMYGTAACGTGANEWKRERESCVSRLSSPLRMRRSDSELKLSVLSFSVRPRDWGYDVDLGLPHFDPFGCDDEDDTCSRMTA